jgi:Dyp-type peroxidase family
VIARRVHIDLADLQGNILAGYGNAFAYGTYLFVSVTDPFEGRRFLRELADRVTTAAPWGRRRKPLTTLNVALTAKGLQSIGMPRPMLSKGFAKEFCAGMRNRAEILGDENESAPDKWEAPLDDPELLVTAFARDDRMRTFQDEWLRERIAATDGGLTAPEKLAHATLLHRAGLIGDENPAMRKREHFGFTDGFSQPAVRGYAKPSRLHGMGTPSRLGRWRWVAPGEFVLGYPGEDGLLPEAPPAPFGRNGTYMVLRKLEQDVEAFERYLIDAAEALPSRLPPGHPAFAAEAATRKVEVAGKIVGRWPDGRSLVQFPHDPRGEGRTDDETRPARINNFRYFDSDPDGFKCPLGAHVRRANPRDSMGFRGQLTRRHRIIRRSMPYGPRYDPGNQAEAKEPRGLMFACFQASIARQFEVIQGQWLNNGDSFWLGDDKDLLTRGDAMMLQGTPPTFIPKPGSPFVTTRGGGYFLVPGLTALRALGSACWR